MSAMGWETMLRMNTSYEGVGFISKERKISHFEEENCN